MTHTVLDTIRIQVEVENEDLYLEVWLGYMEFERLHNGYKNIRVIYNRAQHMIKDMNAFEEKFNLFQVQGHL